MTGRPSFPARTTEQLNRRVRAAGLLAFSAYAVLVPLSYGIAVVSPFSVRHPTEIAAFQTLVNSGVVPSAARPFLSRYVSGDSILATISVRTTIYVALLALASLGAVAATALLAFNRTLIADSTIATIKRIALALGLVHVVLYPMFTQDMWMSVVWGRMIVAGHNPYYENFSAAALAGTPMFDFPIRMTYGPLWAWISAAVMNFPIRWACASIWWLTCGLPNSRGWVPVAMR